MNKPTHLLIKITDLDDRFKELKSLSDKAYPEFKSFYNSAASEVILIKGLGREVSLTEEDVEKKASDNCKYEHNKIE